MDSYKKELEELKRAIQYFFTDDMDSFAQDCAEGEGKLKKYSKVILNVLQTNNPELKK